MTTFALRLNRLFDTVRPPGRGPYRSAEVASGIRDAGSSMSSPYLCQLRSGKRGRPSWDTMAALAAFFGIEPDYFTDDGVYFRRVDRDLAFLALQDDQDVRRAANDIAVLSPEGRQAVYALLRQLRDSPDGLGSVVPTP